MAHSRSPFSTLPGPPKRPARSPYTQYIMNQMNSRASSGNATPVSTIMDLAALYLMDRGEKGQHEKKVASWNETMGNALKARKTGVKGWRNPDTGETGPSFEPGMGAMRHVLGRNEDTAGLANQMELAQILKGEHPPAAPTVQTRFNQTTGREEKVSWDAATRQWMPFGGAKAPAVKPPASGMVADGQGGWMMAPKFREFSLERAGKLSSQTTVNMGGDPLNRELAKLTARDISEQRKKGRAAVSIVNELGQVEELFDIGVETGFGQDYLNTARKLGARLGIRVDQGQVAGAEFLKATTQRLVAPLVKQLGSKPTDRDLQFIVETFPQLTNSIEGNRLVVTALKRAQQREVELTKLMNTFYRQPANRRQGGFIEVAERFVAENPVLNDQERQQLFHLVQGTQPGGGGAGGKPASQYGAGADPLPEIDLDAAEEEYLRRGYELSPR